MPTPPSTVPSPAVPAGGRSPGFRGTLMAGTLGEHIAEEAAVHFTGGTAAYRAPLAGPPFPSPFPLLPLPLSALPCPVAFPLAPVPTPCLPWAEFPRPGN